MPNLQKLCDVDTLITSNWESLYVDKDKYLAILDQWYAKIEPDYKITDFKRLFKMLLVSNKYEEVNVVVNFLSRMDK